VLYRSCILSNPRRMPPERLHSDEEGEEECSILLTCRGRFDTFDSDEEGEEDCSGSVVLTCYCRGRFKKLRKNINTKEFT
jgi:hypothetical protein